MKTYFKFFFYGIISSSQLNQTRKAYKNYLENRNLAQTNRQKHTQTQKQQKTKRKPRDYKRRLEKPSPSSCNLAASEKTQLFFFLPVAHRILTECFPAAYRTSCQALLEFRLFVQVEYTACWHKAEDITSAMAWRREA